MKTNCDIIRDLLPLYAEHITSEATNALVEEHLAECEACRAELEQMEQPVPVRPEAQPDAPLRRIRAALQRRSIRAVIGSVLAALCALALIFWMGTACIPATTEQAQFWTYNRKENGADICILEAQGEGVWLDMEGTFSWGKPQITVRAMRYRFPGVHRVLTALVGSDRSTVWVMVSRTQLLTVDCADQTLYYRDGQLVDRYIVQENPDVPSTTPTAPTRNTASTIRRAEPMDIDSVYRLYFRDVFLFLQGLTHNEALAEELTQETFFKALDGLKGYDDRQDVRAWLFTVARNTYYSHCRRTKRTAPLEDAETAPADTPDIAQLLVDQDAAFTVHQCLHTLDEPYKEVFSLRVFGELPLSASG